MVWYLRSTTDAGLRFSLVPGKEMVVGRKDCDILITSDQSISRKHAIIHLSDDSSNVVHLTDCKSKFGTVVNKKKLAAHQKVPLHHNDIIKFGQGPVTAHSTFKLVQEPLVFCCSAMGRQEVSKVKQLAKALGAEVVSTWSERCSHLVMTSITVTVKVVSALSSCRPIISPAWLEEALCCRGSARPLPPSSSYQPEVVDSNVRTGTEGTDVSFSPDYNRTVLFQDQVFYFLSDKQYSRLKCCLQSAGATCHLVSASGSLSLDALVAKESVVLAVDNDLMKQATPTDKQWVEQVYEFLSSHHLRPIQDSEIGFALLYMSTGEYCNPRTPLSLPGADVALPPPTLSQAPFSDHTHTHTLPFTQDTHTQDYVTILAPDSEDISQSQTAEPKLKTTATGTAIQRINETIVKSSLEVKSPSQGGPSSGKVKVAGGVGIKSVAGGVGVKNEPLDLLFNISDDEGPQVEVRRKEEGSLRGEGEKVKMEWQEEVETKREREARIEGERGGAHTSSQSGAASQRSKLKLRSPRGNKRSHLLAVAEEREKEAKRTSLAVDDEPLGRHTVPGGMKLESPVAGSSQSALPGLRGSLTKPIGQKNTQISPPLSTAATTALPSSQSSDLVPPSLPEQEDSVIVPCSLTPRHSEDGKGKAPMPDSALLAFAFKGRRKKRGNDGQSDVAERERKRPRMEEEEEGKELGESKREGMKEGEMGKEREVEGEMVVEGEGVRESTDGTALGGKSNKAAPLSASGDLEPTGTRNSSAVPTMGNGKESAPAKAKAKSCLMEGLPLLETYEDILRADSRQQQTREHSSELGEVSMDTDRCAANVPAPSPSSRRASPPCPPMVSPSRKRPPSTPSSSKFLTTRKKRKSPHNHNSSSLTNTPALPLPSTASPQTGTSQLRLPPSQAMAGSDGTTTPVAHGVSAGENLPSPFTSLVTGGRRRKTHDSENVAADPWNDVDESNEELGGEDPLINGDMPKRTYKPVINGDGFICSRMKPKLQTSRLGRLAAFVARDSQNTGRGGGEGEGADGGESSVGSGGGGGREGAVQPVPTAEVVITRMVAKGGGGEGGMVGGGGAMETDGDIDGQRPRGSVRNFKKFRKGASEVNQEEESSQDLFRYTSAPSALTRKKRRV